MGSVKTIVDIDVDGESNEIKKEVNPEDIPGEDLPGNLSDEVNFADLANLAKLAVNEIEHPELDVTEKSKAIEQVREVHSQLQSQAQVNSEIARDKMDKKHNAKRNKKTVEYKVGDKVSLKIPSIDVGGSELRRLPCIISKVVSNKYVLTSEYGIIENKYGAQELEYYNGILEIDLDKVNNLLSLRAAAAKAGNRSKQMNEIEVSCDCMSSCQTKRCECYKAQLPCNSHCHIKKSIDLKKCSNIEKN